MSEMWGRPVRLFLTSEPPEAIRAALVEALDLVDFGMALLTPDLRLRFLNRATGEVDAETGFTSAAIFERAGNPIVPISSMLPLNFLPAGGYKIEVSVMRETGDPVVRTADFDIY